MSYKLIISVVPQYKGDLITNTARDAGCPGGTVLMGTETSANGLVQLLGFGDAPKEITYNLTPDDKAPAVISEFYFLLPLTNFLKPVTEK